MATQQLAGYTLALTEEEQAALLRLLEESLREIQGERRRTEAPGYQEELDREEAQLRGLVERVRRLRR